MTGRERGFLLLSSHLGNPDRVCLSPAKLRVLAQRVALADRRVEDRDLVPEDLVAIGFDRGTAQHITALLEEEQRLDVYLRLARRAGCTPITRGDPAYPVLLRSRLGQDSPGCLWLKGDTTILNTPSISLVGSRDLGEPNRVFARMVGQQAARQGLTLVSGNARGADREAQEACLGAGGRVISILADSLTKYPCRKNLLYVSEDSFDLPFSAHRAISRNRIIHTLGQMVFVAQATLEKGGTWDGTAKNLRHGWSTVVCFRDGSEASSQLEQMGAWLVGTEDLPDLMVLKEQNISLFDR